MNSSLQPGQRELALRTLAAAAFLVFFQAYLVAPLIPALARQFHRSPDEFGLLIPAYMLPYGVSTLFYGPLSDRIGRKSVILVLLGMLSFATAGFATARNPEQLIAWRVVGGVATGGIVPLSLAFLGDIFPYEERGRPLGWIFGAIAGGMAFGSTLGAFLNPILGWRVEFLTTAACSFIVFCFTFSNRQVFVQVHPQHALNLKDLLLGYLRLYGDARAAKAYAYIFLNGVFHSGIFSWLALYFVERYHLGDRGVGIALLGYGVPGMLLGPLIGRTADRFGRRRMIPSGIFLAAATAALLIPHTPLPLTAVLTAALSLGYDMSHPLLAGIITSVNPRRRGLAMGMNAFVLFTGLGMGTWIFQILLRYGFPWALAIFAVVQALLGVASLFLFQGEIAS